MKRIGIIAALTQEAACLTGTAPVPGEPVPIDERFLLIVSGSGGERAGRAAARLIEEDAGALISFGFAGALAEGLDAGALLVPDAVITNGGRCEIGRRWRSRVAQRLEGGPGAVRSGALACSDTIVSSPSQKRVLRQRTGAVAVDMESAAVITAAAGRGLPSLVIRSVLDPAHMTLPEAIVRCSDAFGRVRSAALLRALLAHPSLWPSVMELRRAFHAAVSTLRWLGLHRGTVLNHAPDTD